MLTLIVTHGLAVVTVVFAARWTHSKPRPCRATFEQVQMGMTQAEVYTAVGGPPGGYSVQSWPTPQFGVRGTADEVWVCDEAELNVWYTESGHVRNVRVGPSDVSYPHTRLERLRVWVTDGYDVDDLPRSWARVMYGSAGRYDLDGLRNILNP